MLARGIALTLALAACGDPPPSKYPVQQVYVEDTTLGPRDLFEVRVFRQVDLTGDYEVSPECTISFPMIGPVKVCGHTPPEIEKNIQDRLAAGYLQNPQVSVLVKEYKSKTVSVFGQVKKPGTLSYSAGMTVVEAISQAGGFNEMARKNAVIVTRKQDGKKINYVVPVDSIGQGKAENLTVRPGDVVFVPRRVI
jgi:protein involved in polysaccharide export with SLBB domain